MASKACEGRDNLLRKVSSSSQLKANHIEGIDESIEFLLRGGISCLGNLFLLSRARKTLQSSRNVSIYSTSTGN